MEISDFLFFFTVISYILLYLLKEYRIPDQNTEKQEAETSDKTIAYTHC